MCLNLQYGILNIEKGLMASIFVREGNPADSIVLGTMLWNYALGAWELCFKEGSLGAVDTVFLVL